MQTVGLSGDILLGVSQTSDPNGAWFLYRFAIGFQLDFPIVGFNKNWISISINRYSNIGAFQRGINLVVDYGQARSGVGTGTLFTQPTGTHFCSAPCATYSSTSDTMYVVTHLSSGAGTYALDTITGTASAPVYTAGGVLTRPGGGWAQPSGQQLPQSAPNSGASSCGATPCPIEVQDSQVRSAPVYRGGFIYYTQTIGLPSPTLTHTAAQWTKLNTPGGALVDGGRIEAEKVGLDVQGLGGADRIALHNSEVRAPDPVAGASLNDEAGNDISMTLSWLALAGAIFVGLALALHLIHRIFSPLSSVRHRTAPATVSS